MIFKVQRYHRTQFYLRYMYYNPPTPSHTHTLSDRRGRYRIVDGFTVSITTKVVNSNTVNGEVYSKQRYAIKFVSDLQQVGGFLRVLRFPPSIKLTATLGIQSLNRSN